MTTPTIRTAVEWFETFWCGCGDGEPGKVLRDYLATFLPDGEDERDPETREWEDDRRPYFIDLAASRAFAEKYGNDVAHLIAYLLAGAGIIEHSGSVVSSAWLTSLGVEVKARADAGDFEGAA